MYRNTYVSIKGDVLKKNIIEIKKHYPDYQYYIGVVKGNAYGHGIYCVNSLIQGGVNYLAVSSLEEALSIRTYQKEIPILCLEPISISSIDIARENKITLTVESYEYLKELQKKLQNRMKIHLKLDTGMNRLGIKEKEELLEILKEIKKDKNIELEGIYTHFATQGVHDIYWDKQYQKFQYLLEGIDLSTIKIIHMGRSLTLVNHDKPDFVNGIRLGIIMYGFNQSISLGYGILGKLRQYKRKLYLKKTKISPTHLSNSLSLSTAFSLYTEVMSIKKVKAGEVIGYRALYRAKEDMKVAVLPIGYADGMSEKLKEVVINGKKYPIVGEICMDMTMIKIDDQVSLYDKVEIFGNTISIKEAALKKESNVYQLFLSITSRVPRVYDDQNEIKY